MPSRRTSPAISRIAAVIVAAVLAVVQVGCVHTYQPISGLHRPVVVDVTAPNLEGVALTVVCHPGDWMNSGEARLLCERVGRLFENQGAQVVTVVPGRRSRDEEVGDTEIDEEKPPTTDLVLELRTRRLHTSNDPLTWVACFATATLLPAVTENTFAQDVVVKDATGFLLATDSLQGRLVRTFGVGPWLGHKIADRFWRRKEEEIGGDAAHRDLSADFYGQMSQVVFNATMRWRVLQEATPAGRATSP